MDFASILASAQIKAFWRDSYSWTCFQKGIKSSIVRFIEIHICIHINITHILNYKSLLFVSSLPLTFSGQLINQLLLGHWGTKLQSPFCPRPWVLSHLLPQAHFFSSWIHPVHYFSITDPWKETPEEAEQGSHPLAHQKRWVYNKDSQSPHKRRCAM